MIDRLGVIGAAGSVPRELRNTRCRWVDGCDSCWLRVYNLCKDVAVVCKQGGFGVVLVKRVVHAVHLEYVWSVVQGIHEAGLDDGWFRVDEHECVLGHDETPT